MRVSDGADQMPLTTDPNRNTTNHSWTWVTFN